MQTWTIGELAERAGTTVKTVRFYSDRGLLPEAGRSTGGHRRYGPEALERLRLIRSLRVLDLPVPEVGRVLDGLDDPDGPRDALEDAVAERLNTLGERMAALRWREAALRLLRDAAPEDRAEVLRLVGALDLPPSTAPLARFWRGWYPPRLPARLRRGLVDASVPQLPDDPEPGQVLALAQLHAFATAPCGSPQAAAEGSAAGAAPGLPPPPPAAHRADTGYRPEVLYDGLGEAVDLTAPLLRAGRAPRPGEALNSFVDAHARACGARDTPEFRRALAARLAAEPRIDRYWRLAGIVNGPAQPTLGAVHDWLLAALGAEADAEGPVPLPA